MVTGCKYWDIVWPKEFSLRPRETLLGHEMGIRQPINLGVDYDEKDGSSKEAIVDFSRNRTKKGIHKILIVVQAMNLSVFRI
jgi:hypothetical protein